MWKNRFRNISKLKKVKEWKKNLHDRTKLILNFHVQTCLYFFFFQRNFDASFKIQLKVSKTTQKSCFDYLYIYYRFWMAVPFLVPRNDVQLYWTPSFSCWQACRFVWNIYRLPQGFFTGRRQYPRIKMQLRKDEPLTEIPKLWKSFEEPKFKLKSTFSYYF